MTRLTYNEKVDIMAICICLVYFLIWFLIIESLDK